MEQQAIRFMGLENDLLSNKEIERSVLANIIDNHKLLMKLNEFEEDIFYSTMNQKIFKMLRVTEKKYSNIDMYLIGDYIIKNKQEDITLTMVTEIVAGGIYASATDEYISILIDLYRKRQLKKTITSVDFRKDADEIKSGLLKGMNEVHSVVEEETTEETIMDTLNEILSGVTQKGVMTGITEIDVNLMGLNKGELITISARSGIGKTTLALNMFTYQCFKGYKPHYFSLEMPKKELIKKMLSIKSGIKGNKIRRNQVDSREEQQLVALANDLASKKFEVYDNNSKIEYIENKIREEHIKGNCDIAYIDLINRVTTTEKTGSRAEYIGSITRRLKQLALELMIPIVILAQINRGAEQRTDRRPQLSDLKESGSIEEDSDVVISVYRNLIVCDRNYKGQLDYSSNDPDLNPDRVEIGFMKSRYTGNAVIPMIYQGDIGVIREIMR